MAFLPFIAGMAKGVSETYGNISEEKRKQEFENTKLVADSIRHRLENDSSLTPEEGQNLLGQFLDLHKIPKDQKEHILNTSEYFRGKLQNQQAAEQAPVAKQTQQQMQQEAAPLTDASPQGSGLGDLPTMQGGSAGKASQLAPPIPEMAQNQTMGQLRFPQQIQQAAQLETAKAHAARDAQLQMLDAENDYKVKKLDEIQKRTDLTPQQKSLYSEIITGKPMVRPQGQFAPGSTSGKDLLESHPTDVTGAVTDPNKDYRSLIDKATGQVMEIYPTNLSARATDWVKLDGSQTGFGHVIRKQNGDILRVEPDLIPPAYLLQTLSTTNTARSEVQPDGTTKLIPVTTSTQRGKEIPGGSANVTPGSPLPSMPVGAPGSASTKPTPGQPKARVGGGGTVVGGRPLAPEAKIKNAQQAELYNTSIGTIKSLRRDIPTLASMISTGKIGMQVDPDQGVWHAVINRNMDMSPEEQRIAGHWQQLADQILELRIPLGAAAGRNAAMMNIIESNKGILTQKPEIIQAMLENALGEFKNLRDPLIKAGEKYDYPTSKERDHAIDEDPGNMWGPKATPNTPLPGDKVTYIEGNDRYSIPVDKIAAFEKAHPKAKRQK